MTGYQNAYRTENYQFTFQYCFMSIPAPHHPLHKKNPLTSNLYLHSFSFKLFPFNLSLSTHVKNKKIKKIKKKISLLFIMRFFGSILNKPNSHSLSHGTDALALCSFSWQSSGPAPRASHSSCSWRPLDREFQMGPQEGRVEGDNQLPLPAGRSSLGAVRIQLVFQSAGVHS